MAYAAAEIDGWFESFEGAFEGKLSDDHMLIRAFGGQGWRVRTMGVELMVVADRNFPYSKPQAFIGDYDRRDPKPHVEPAPALGGIAKICLDTPTAPADPLGAVQAAFHEARQLLKANENGDEEGDFESDFGSYWLHYLPQNAHSARLSLTGISQGLCAFFYSKTDIYYCFPDKVSLRRFAKHLWKTDIREPHQFPVIELGRVPRPNRYPLDSETFITFLKRYTSGGLPTVGALLRAVPRRLPVVFSLEAKNGRRFKVAVELLLRIDEKGRRPVKARLLSKLSDQDVIRLYDVAPLNTRDMDSSLSRLPNSDLAELSKKTVVIVGCGAMGSGIVSLLAKSGVCRFVLIDDDTLGWENIRRHELGAESVGMAKVDALKARLERQMPSIEGVVVHRTTLQKAINENPALISDADLIISATGDWSCDAFLDSKVKDSGTIPPIIYAWTEAYGLASHAVLISGEDKFVNGFDVSGNFKGTASRTELSPPAECGNSTSPFGAVEVSQSQALATRLALEAITGSHTGASVWRTWTAEERTVLSAEGAWSEYWLRSHGVPPKHGGVVESDWSF